MAGEQTLPIQECPDTISETVSVVLAQTGGDFVDNQYIFYAERDVVLDAAFCIFGTNDGDATLKLTTGSSGAVASGTDMTSALDIDGTAGTPVAITITTTANIIPAGNWIGVEITNTSTAEEVMVQLRLRSRVL